MTTVLAPGWWAHDELEAAGLDLWQAFWMEIKFTRLVPANLRIECRDEDRPVHDGEDECLGCAIVWDSLTLTEQHERDWSRCLWDFIALDQADNDHILSFIARWGSPNFGYDADVGREDREAWIYCDELRDEARAVRISLHALVASEDGRLVDLDSLDLLSRLSSWMPPEDSGEAAERRALFGTTNWNERFGAERAVWRRWREKERRSGQGLAHQRALLVYFLEFWAGSGSSRLEWEGSGRTVTAEAMGASDLAGSALREIFAAPELNIFTCSMCGRLFEFVEADFARRPRRGSRRFCGAECRALGRKESNRASWQRNKSVWRPSPNSTPAKEATTKDEQAR